MRSDAVRARAHSPTPTHSPTPPRSLPPRRGLSLVTASYADPAYATVSERV